MAKLILTLDDNTLREVSLDRERITIGRKPSNDIQIDDLAVSGEHACVVTVLNDSVLEDMGSTNGTLVNGRPVTKHILRDNDVIEIGRNRIRYAAGAPASAAAATGGFEQTMILQPAAGPAPARPAASAQSAVAAAPGEGQPLAAVQILSGPNAGRELGLVKNLTTLGKPGVQVAVITRRPHGYFITHVEGAVFPIVNGKSIESMAQPLRDHDVIELAGVKMEFFIKN